MVRYRSSLESTFEKYLAVRKAIEEKTKIPWNFRAFGFISLFQVSRITAGGRKDEYYRTQVESHIRF